MGLLPHDTKTSASDQLFNNDLTHFQYNQKEWKVISSHNFHEKIYATPSLGRGRIYLRTDKALYCFKPV
jgi:hypothetical protein